MSTQITLNKSTVVNVNLANVYGRIHNRALSSSRKMAMARKPRVLLCASGSVATVKVPALAVRLAKWAEVGLDTSWWGGED